MIRLWNVQLALYGVLHGDATLLGMVTGIIDEPEQNQLYPYITIGESTGTVDDLLIETGAQQTMTLSVWDKDSPVSRTKQILDRMITLLHNRPLTISLTQSVSCRVEMCDVNRDVDTVHGVLRVRVATFG